MPRIEKDCDCLVCKIKKQIARKEILEKLAQEMEGEVMHHSHKKGYSTAQFFEDMYTEKGDQQQQKIMDYLDTMLPPKNVSEDTKKEIAKLYDELKRLTTKQTSKPPYSKNFCRVFELPDSYPEGYCFGGGKPVTMLMVDWFNPWPDNPELETWEDVAKLLLPFLQKKTYVKPNKRYILITDFGASLVFEKGTENNNG